MITILALGDVVGRPGRQALRALIPQYRQKMAIDLVIANGENAAGGSGLDVKCAQEIRDAGVDIITLGDHTWQRGEINDYLEKNKDWCIRPTNYPPGAPGSGYAIKQVNNLSIGVFNIIGRVFINQFLDCPFRAADTLIAGPLKSCDVIICDMHAEATSEKRAMGYFLDGRATLVFGTHTHVQTADEAILPKGTAYITDLGMCGPSQSVLGLSTQISIDRFVTGLKHSYQVAEGPVALHGVLVKVDSESHKAQSIERVVLST